MMHSKFVTGILIGAAVGMMMEVDRSAKRKMKKTSRRIKNAAGDFMGWIR
ncbi:MAG: YtxH domain-containing protein [Clostridium sp.]|jgi:predicted membrane-bound spermidine synthase|nr:YtxH domain-containing protein [Clostridium sp.]MCH3965006.1 YtxH domain-containing protein [Clostridium sp.]MCI1714227.1 YtxH domain-containing protein [Clostridium sp.]MCI1798489.1 YtxH domain-containing protein [Clostridium sp.]MCI1812780.1 YtxH domain-containing protein [Clostridium sp.]MCI1869298.1 YtxH domain-containing protein [Clostridium sp.]